MIGYGFGVSLGPLDSKYLEKTRGWRNDYRIWQWCRQNDLITDVSQHAWFDKIQEDPYIKMYAILPNNDTDPIGVCGLTSIDNINRRAEFSLYVAPKSQGSGYAIAALKTLLKHAFENLNLNLIWGETFDGNPAAKMFEKLGFKKEGTRREFYFKNGKYIDAHLYSVKREEVVWNG